MRYMPFAPQEVVETQAACGLQMIIEELAHALLLEFCHPRNQRQGPQTHEQFINDFPGQRYVRGHD